MEINSQFSRYCEDVYIAIFGDNLPISIAAPEKPSSFDDNAIELDFARQELWIQMARKCNAHAHALCFLKRDVMYYQDLILKKQQQNYIDAKKKFEKELLESVDDMMGRTKKHSHDEVDRNPAKRARNSL